ncbi:hypothetical protein BGP77_01480 [Saccharospirillum sp. MSK14-1]|nr:hypothetical protein BGP77_01480 [Saccharospirillum sp. MSK14-1]
MPSLKNYGEGEPPKVIIHGGGPLSSVYSEPRHVKDVSVKHLDAPRYITEQLTNRVAQNEHFEMMRDVPLSLSHFLDNNETSVTQSATQYRYSTLNENSSPIDPAKFVVDHNDPSSEIELSLTTDSGDTLTFVIRRESGYGHDGIESGVQFQTLSVEFQLDGKLSQKEKQELDSLAIGLNRLANEYFSGGGVSLAKLGLDDMSGILELKLSIDDGRKPGLDLSMTETDQRRNIDVEFFGNHIELSVDKTGLTGSAEGTRRQAALAHYRQILREGLDRAQGSGDQKALLLDAFDMLYGLVDETVNQQELTAAESMMMSGLPDFFVHFEGRTVRQNTHPVRQDQVETVSLTLAQETVFKQDGSLNRQIDQRQIWELDAGYFEPLDHWDFVDFQNQNYQYYELSERAEIRTMTGLLDGDVYGTQSRTFESRFDAQEYRMGELVDWKTTTRSLHELRDFSARLRNLDDLNNKVLLAELVLDPTELSKLADVERVDQDESAISKVSVPQGTRQS